MQKNSTAQPSNQVLFGASAQNAEDGTSKGCEFEEFWREYPRKVGKLKAERIWSKLTESERIVAMTGLFLWRQANQWHQADGQFIPYASTFLAQKRYLDEPWTGAFEGK